MPICKQISDLRSYILICNWFIFHVLNRKTIANGQVPKPSPPPGGPTLSLFRHWLGSLQGGSSIAQRPSTDRGRMVAGEGLSARFKASLEPACYALALSPNRKVTLKHRVVFVSAAGWSSTTLPRKYFYWEEINNLNWFIYLGYSQGNRLPHQSG